MNDNPTIQDILNWYSNWEKSPEQEWSELNLFPGIPMGQMPEDFKGQGFALQGKQDMASYMHGLLEDAGHAPEDSNVTFSAQKWKDIGSSGFHDWQKGGYEKFDVPIADIMGTLFQQETPFTEMSKEDIEALLREGITTPESYDPSKVYYEDTGAEHSYYTGETKWDEANLDEMISLFQKLQEGLGVMEGVSPEAWGLGTKLGDVEESAERESKKLLQSYIPSETESRYKTLMGGSPVEGELAEAEYLASQFGGQRQLGRDVSDIYGTYEEDVFGRLSDFISNLG